jgi:hypothetical protein
MANIPTGSVDVGRLLRRTGIVGSGFNLVLPVAAAAAFANLVLAAREGRPADITAASFTAAGASLTAAAGGGATAVGISAGASAGAAAGGASTVLLPEAGAIALGVGGTVLAVIGVLVTAGILGDAFAEQSRRRRDIRQTRREFKRKLSRFAGPDVVRGAGIHLRTRAARLGRGNPFRPQAQFGPEGFRLPIEAAVPAAIASALGRKGSKLGIPDLDTLVRGFGFGPEADRLRQIEIDKVRGQRGRLGGGAIPAIFSRLRRAA